MLAQIFSSDTNNNRKQVGKTFRGRSKFALVAGNIKGMDSQMKNVKIRSMFNAFPKCFLGFTALFAVIYLFARSQGAPAFGEQSDLSILESLTGIFIAILVFSFWLTMFIDFLNSSIKKNRALWGICFVIFSWLTALVWFLSNASGGPEKHAL